MNIVSTGIDDLYVIEPKVYGDERGYFMETFRVDTLKKYGIENEWVQDNEAYSRKGVLRGLHYQLSPMAQSKLVRVIRGKVQDIVVDIRPDSKTHGTYYSIILSAENKKQLLVPRGFAHGYLTLSEEAIFVYKCDNYYDAKLEHGISTLDPALNLPWEAVDSDYIISDKDKLQPNFNQHTSYR